MALTQELRLPVQPPTPATRFDLSADASAVLAEQAALQLLATKTALNLTTEQWNAFATVIVNAQAVRQAFEATIATPTLLGTGRYRLEIPSYPAAGDALRARLRDDLSATLGDDLANEIFAELGGSLDGHFGGFGISVQTLEFIADPTGSESDYRVVRTVTFWNSVNATERLSTRRETHFPGREDPSGHSWGPFLSILAAKVAEKAGS